MIRTTARNAFIQGFERTPVSTQRFDEAQQLVAPQQPRRLMSLKEVLTHIPVSKTTWYDGIKKGIYPKGYNLGGRRVGWRSTDIDTLVAKLTGEV
ncbi:helix-turn-helix transcriptional regulator [Aeromonas diversa]|uniref:Phage transcriptional regulator, AlpA n=1 Tax=Aeromonas diversa CDC 2478-85 TaxID=1268237 RepID=N9TYH7_9GAMM|nr:AlpA family phage regulatory protein [Aeromonas diversa]ENY71115.1 phage transcriptional regulator, AlpA [Aeromonas diversa CDC 2478-85]